MAYEPAEPHNLQDLVKAVQLEGLVKQQAEAELIRLRGRELAQEQYDEEKHGGHAYTWAQVDHDVAFAMSRERTMPDIGHMTETPSSPPLPLFYAGKINGVHGDSESGKSWLMQYVAAQELKARRHVLYVDFEDDAGGVYGRLLKLGVTEAEIRELFHYVNPKDKMTVFERASWQGLIGMDVTHSLAVVDGVTEAMSLENLTGRDEGEVAKWHALVTKPLAACGWGVGMIDHTPHSETRVIGSQHKRSAITGVSYSIDSTSSFAKGQCGKSVMRVDKDRPGWIRSEAAPGQRPQWYGTFVLDETMGFLNPSIWPWKPESVESAQGFEERPPEAICEAIVSYVTKNPGCSSTAIRESVRGRTQTKNVALEWLIINEMIKTEDAGRHKIKHYVNEDPQ